jgi:dihydroxyacetone kinase-like predicted kinase
VVVAAGEGLERLFTEAGAAVVPASGRRPSAGEVLTAITGCGAEEVVVLPNDRDSVAVAEAAARAAREEEELRVAVIPTSAQVQGLAALAVHEPGRALRGRRRARRCRRRLRGGRR